MTLLAIVDQIGEGWTLAAGGLLIGAVFGAFAQQSKFCLRAATVEFGRGAIGQKTVLWLLVFSIAIFATQMISVLGLVDTSEARQLASPQSLSGAVLGGLIFGSGMVLARGCASRLLVLSATGNLRALLSGLVFAVVAQASLRGFLSPVRETLAGVATSNMVGGNSLLQMPGISQGSAFVLSAVALAGAIALSTYRNLSIWQAVSALGVGATIPLAWWFTASMSAIAFEPVQLEAITFTGPSADFLMMFLSPLGGALDFDIGLVPGVYLGSLAAAAITGQIEIAGFEGGQAMKRYLLGAAMMGFGGMLAGGCAVGAGVTGASIFAITAWLTLFAIWLAAIVTDWAIDRKCLAPSISRPNSAS